jgi:hypothetical protein
LTLGHFASQLLDLELLGLHLPLAGKCLLRVGSLLPDPLAQHVLMQVEVSVGFALRAANSESGIQATFGGIVAMISQRYPRSYPQIHAKQRSAMFRLE